MTLLDPKDRSEAGAARQTEILGGSQPEPATLFESSWRDFVFAEVWGRPGLDRRSRYWITIAGAACTGEAPERLDGYIRGALERGAVTVAELREAALHLAVYGGWACGGAVDGAVSRVVAGLGVAEEAVPPIRAEPWDPGQRHANGSASFQAAMTFAGPPPQTAFFDAGILNFVFGEVWTRPGLDRRARRWLTLVAAAQSGSETPIQSHVYAAMASGDATMAEMHEFVLQYAIYASWPKASVLQAAIFKQGPRVAAGEPFL